MSLELARAGEDIAGVVGFHSGLGTAKPDETKSVKPKILICVGAEDPLIPTVRGIRTAGGAPDAQPRRQHLCDPAHRQCRRKGDGDWVRGARQDSVSSADVVMLATDL